MNGVKELWKLKIIHNYFVNGETSSFDLQLTKESTFLLGRRGLLWRRVGLSYWELLDMGQNTLDKDDKITLELSPKNDLLPYVTDMEWGRGTHVLPLDFQKNQSIRMNAVSEKKVVTLPGVLLSLECPIGQLLNRPCVTELVFDSPVLYWEYLLIPRDGNLDRELLIEDQSGKITFGPCERTMFMNIEMLKIRSNEKVSLRDRPSNDLRLYEKVRDMKRIIVPHLPLPIPGRYLSDSKDTIQALSYF